jgi:hypothetical protein
MLVALAAVSELAYLCVLLFGQSLHVEGAGKHSLLTILALFALAFVCYLSAMKVALSARQDGRLLAVISVAAVMFRVTLLFSDPIEEIDLYRYLWDGEATTAGVSPFRYSPRQVLSVEAEESVAPDLGRLVALRDTSPVNSQILDRIHFGDLPTIYPPTSQVVFALATLSTPLDASLTLRMAIMRAWFVAFDLATVILVIGLLHQAGRPIGWSIAYAWCPLVIKEIANSGHLDALAVFLSTLALYLAVRAIFPAERSPLRRQSNPFFTISLAALVLALAIGAKFYPVVLIPLLLAASARRLGLRPTIAAGCLGSLATAIVLWPMVPRAGLAELPQVHLTVADQELPPLPPPDLGTDPRDPSQSLRAFLSEWEMNDFLFLLVMENVRPTDHAPPNEIAWFSITPQIWRYALCRRAAATIGIEEGRAPFFITRAITTTLYLGLAAWFAFRGARSSTAAGFLEAAFLTLVWFWLLLPTQNPWYLIWALPLLPFARSRAWLALSGLALVYYLRFWFAYHFEHEPVLGTVYRGPQFFDYVITWLEFWPWLAWLTYDGLRRWSQGVVVLGNPNCC